MSESARFLIVGSARSGTTLAQRLACELPGVQVPPETHFFDLYVPGVVERGLPPFDADRLEREVEQWCGLPEVAGTAVDPRRLVARLGGHCESLLELFDAIVAELTQGASVPGEKTPNHLFWCPSLMRARPALRVIAVIRDPRAVVSSVLRTPWGRSMFSSRWGREYFVAVTERWLGEEQLLGRLVEEFPERCLVLRYEELVDDPARVRGQMARFLGVADSVDPPGHRFTGTLALAWETWKANVYDDISIDRQTSWRRELSVRRRHVITGMCADRMAAWGYRLSTAERRLGRAALLTVGPMTRRRRRDFRAGFDEHLRWIEEVAL